ncbi:MAG TPA: hypothetical protein VFH25_08695 [Nitrososphaeraceae archaeon]|jgi:thiamine pyrophosphate-dependent acetolactate synthase large subunit-like protein|nr:hypothetical protein [Nitrososphaeraceae archaeon]
MINPVILYDIMANHMSEYESIFSDVAVYNNNMINGPDQAEMTVDIACRSALSQRGVRHLTIPIDVQERKLEGNYSALCRLNG